VKNIPKDLKPRPPKRPYFQTLFSWTCFFPKDLKIQIKKGSEDEPVLKLKSRAFLNLKNNLFFFTLSFSLARHNISPLF